MASVHQLPHEDRRDEGNEWGRPWNIRSELLEHYGANSTDEHNQSSREAIHCFSDRTHNIADIHDGTPSTAQEEEKLQLIKAWWTPSTVL